MKFYFQCIPTRTKTFQFTFNLEFCVSFPIPQNYDNDSLSIQEITAKKMAQLVYKDTKDLEMKEIIERLNKDKDQVSMS